jgi:hypothetical protein
LKKDFPNLDGHQTQHLAEARSPDQGQISLSPQGKNALKTRIAA